MCHTLCRTQFDSVEHFTSIHDVFHGELLHRSNVKNVHEEVPDPEHTVVGLYHRGLLVLVGQLCGGRWNREKLEFPCRLWKVQYMGYPDGEGLLAIPPQ